MTDNSAPHSVSGEKCAIHHSIQQKDLERLLNIVVHSLRVGDSVSDPANQLPKIYTEWLSIEFVRDRMAKGQSPAAFYVNPKLRQRNNDTPLDVLTLQDLVDLFESIQDYAKEKIRRGEYANFDVLDENQMALVDRIEGKQLRADINFLRVDSANLLSIVATLHAGSPAGAEEVEEIIKLPPEFYALIEGELNLAVAWEWVKPLIEDLQDTQLNAEKVVFRYDKGRRSVDVTEVRFFLNTWLKKLYEEYEQRFHEVGLDLPDNRLFDATNRSAGYFDLPTWVQPDRDVATFINKQLTPLIDEFLRTKGPAPVGPAYEDSTNDVENSASLTQDLDANEKDELLRKFEQAGKSYRDETERLTTILLPQFFSMHGVARDLMELQQIDGNDFRLIEREFRGELENVLRSLSPEEFALLSTRGASLEFRLVVLRKLYGKLSTNPRFIGSLQQFRDTYVDYLTELVDKGQASSRELVELNTKINLPDTEFDFGLEAQQRKTRQNWTREISGKDTAALASFSNLHSITKTDLESLLTHLNNGSWDSTSLETLFRNLDVLIAERWSPDQLRDLDITAASVVFGIEFPDLFLQDSARYRLFLQLCTEYLYARRQRLADHYELDVISRDDGKRGGDLTSLAAAQATAERFKDHGGGEALVVARASDTARVKEYEQTKHSFASAITTIHSETRSSREQAVKNQQAETKERFHDMSIDEKRALLSSLGVLTLDLDADNIDESSKLIALYQRFDAAMAEDFADGMSSLDRLSFYEDQDDGVVQEGGEDAAPQRTRPQRYGKPGGRSLMKGALNLRKKYQTAQKRVQQAKKVAKAAGKAFEAVESVLTAPIPIKNKWAKRGILAVGAALFVDFINTIQSGIGAQLGAAAGAVVGGAVTFFTGGSGFFIIPATTYIGAKLGQAAQFGIENIFGGRPEVGYNGPGLSSIAPTVTAPGPSTVMAAKAGIDSAVANAKASAAGLTGSLPSAIATAASGTYLGGTLLVATVITASLQPPPLSTIGSNGIESEYVTIRKQVVGPTNFGDVVPPNLNYNISIQAKSGYEVEIINFQDNFTVTPNEELNTENPADLNCENNLNIDNLQTRVIRPEDGEILIGDCPVTLNQSYHDTSILNQFTVQFRVRRITGEEVLNESPDPSCGENENTFCAMSGATVCIGECPAEQEGCWPTTGTVTQGPFGTYSHSVVDAYDISAPLGREVYATFDGTAWAFDTFSSNPAEQGHIMPTSDYPRIYGKHVVLITNQGFALLYGHLSRHGSTLQLGQPVPVTAGTVVGYVGNSGSTPQFTMGNHLHYEYRTPRGSGWASYAVQGSDPLSNILPGNEPGQPYVYRNGDSVVTCYSPTE